MRTDACRYTINLLTVTLSASAHPLVCAAQLQDLRTDVTLWKGVQVAEPGVML